MSGPCGLLAAVQARVCLELLYGSEKIPLKDDMLEPDKAEAMIALASALTAILLRAGEGHAVVVVDMKDSISYDHNDILNHFHLKIFSQRQCLLAFYYTYLQENNHKMDGLNGSCFLFLCSLILSRGVEKVRMEMQDPNDHLIADNDYCTQELVNLCIIGRAVTHLFDGQQDVGTILHGIPERSEIGFLAAYGDNILIGDYYLNPTWPVWVLASGNHYSVIFAESRKLLPQSKLRHYDGFGMKKEAIYKGVIKEENHLDGCLSTTEKCLQLRDNTCF